MKPQEHTITGNDWALALRKARLRREGAAQRIRVQIEAAKKRKS